MIITISGEPATGKTSTSGRLARHTGFEERYMGDLFRREAERRGQDLYTFYDDLKNDPDLERAMDSGMVQWLQEDDDFILQSRVAFHWKTPEKDRLDVFLTVDPIEGARRFMEAQRSDEKKFETIEECRSYIADRIAKERRRYRDLYGIDDHHDHDHFDLVIDTTDKSKESVAEIIIKECRERGLLE